MTLHEMLSPLPTDGSSLERPVRQQGNRVLPPTQPATHLSPDHRCRRYRRACGRTSAHAIALAFGLLAACEGSEPSAPPPTLDELHERVLQPSCTFATCHGSGPSPAGALALERDVAHASLVDVPSSVVSGAVLVVPGDPDASYVMEKITATMPAVGESMPPDAPLEAERIELIRAWIEAGAVDE